MHLNHVVFIHSIYSLLVQYEQLLYSGPTARAPEYQYLLHINHTKSCPTYWHHIHLLTSPTFCHIFLETPHRPIYIIAQLISQHQKLRLSPMKSTAQLLVPRGPPQQLERRKSPGLCANQRAFSWRACLMSHITPRANIITSAYDIPTRNITIWRKSMYGTMIQNPYLLHIYYNILASV